MGKADIIRDPLPPHGGWVEANGRVPIAGFWSSGLSTPPVSVNPQPRQEVPADVARVDALKVGEDESVHTPPHEMTSLRSTAATALHSQGVCLAERPALDLVVPEQELTAKVQAMNRRRFLCALAGLAAIPRTSGRVDAGCFINATVAVDYDQPSRAIPDNFIGLSYESAVLASPEYLSPGNLRLVGFLRALGPGGVMRLGGNSSERTVWRDTSDMPEVESTVITPAAIDALVALLNILDWSLIYGLNLARGTPMAAAEEAVYVAQAAGPRLLAIQIGNEPDGFGRWSGLRPQSYNCDAFLREWQQFQAAIRARLPTIPFAGPDIASEQSWIRPFIEAAGDALVLVTRHYYADGPAGAPYISLARLLGSAPKVEPLLEEMRSISESYRVPFRIAETNSIFMEGQPGVSDAFGSALWAVEFMFQVAEAGGQGVNFHTGDAKAYTPIGPGPVGRLEARPLYYGILMFKETARGATLLPARLVASGLNVAAYATRIPDGTLKVCLINKDLERGARVAIETGQHFTSASLLRLTAPSAEARTDVTFGGSAIDDFGHWSPQPSKLFPWEADSFVEVPAASAVIVQLH